MGGSSVLCTTSLLLSNLSRYPFIHLGREEQVRVKCLAQGHNTWANTGSNSQPWDLESGAPSLSYVWDSKQDKQTGWGQVDLPKSSAILPNEFHSETPKEHCSPEDLGFFFFFFFFFWETTIRIKSRAYVGLVLTFRRTDLHHACTQWPRPIQQLTLLSKYIKPTRCPKLATRKFTRKLSTTIEGFQVTSLQRNLPSHAAHSGHVGSHKIWPNSLGCVTTRYAPIRAPSRAPCWIFLEQQNML